MLRAAVFIGVDRAGDLPQLRDAASSARRLYEDALLQQQFAKRELITDENGAKVTADQIYDVIDRLTRPRNLTQLLIYFAGHGVNRNQGEYWLLSDAPKRPAAAVNLRGTEFLARYSRIPHVIFISDACRTAVQGLQAENVTGSEIFPNWDDPGEASPVDLFYAAGLGKPAHEIRKVDDAVKNFKAIYTEALHRALRLDDQAAVEWVTENGADVAYVRPRALRNYLKQALAERLADPQLQGSVNQVPEAIISSEPEAWIVRVEGRTRPQAQGGPEPPRRDDSRDGLEGGFDDSVPDDVPRAPVSTRKALESLVTMAMRGPADVADALAVTVPAGPTRFESQCGFKLRGARIQDAYAVGAGVQQLGPARDVARVTPRDATPLVLFVLDNGNGVVLPAIPGFIGALKFDGDELIDVAYEPSDNTDRAVHFRSQARELRALRQVVATASREGVFWLQRDKAATLARRMQVMKGVDPSLAVYAAYAYDDLHETRRLAETDRYLRGDLGASLFDVAMLAGRLDRRSAAEWPPLFGPFPLLAQGWAYLRARRIELAHDGAALQPHLADSLWTVFGPGGVEHLRSHLFREAEPWQPG